MKTIKLFNLFLFITFFLTLPSQANWRKVDSKDFEMPPPPEPNSAEYKKDFKTLHELQDNRDDKDCKLAKAQFYPTIEAFYGKSAKLFTKHELITVEPLLKDVFKLSNKIAHHFKDEFLRDRPYDTDETILPCVDKPGGNKAYPSSHAVLASIGACVLAKIFPSKSEKINTYGNYLGDLRMIVGVHHPSDVKAGQVLAKDICKRLLTEDDFKDELAAVKAEVKK